MIERLITIAKKERIPYVDVSGTILARIRVGKVRKSETVRVMSWAAGISAIAASIIMFFSFQFYQESQDPLRQYFAPIPYSEVNLY